MVGVSGGGGGVGAGVGMGVGDGDKSERQIVSLSGLRATYLTVNSTSDGFMGCASRKNAAAAPGARSQTPTRGCRLLAPGTATALTQRRSAQPVHTPGESRRPR